jgi:peptidoglycan/LPS O-acetylase OafA/YrhL
MADQRKNEILGIDLARFVAATMVVIWHFAGKPWLDPQGATITPLMPPAPPSIPPGAGFSSIGWIGVQVFFVISGAVIAFSAARAQPPRLPDQPHHPPVARHGGVRLPVHGALHGVLACGA